MFHTASRSSKARYIVHPPKKNCGSDGKIEGFAWLPRPKESWDPLNVAQDNTR